MQPDDVYWRRPAPDERPPAAGPGEGSAGTSWAPSYTGPPPTMTPPAGWRPDQVVKPAPPRQLPRQDHASIDAEEEQARTLTFGTGLLATAVLVVIVCLLFGRALV